MQPENPKANQAKRLLEILAIIAVLYHVAEFLLGVRRFWIIATACLTAVALYFFVYRDPKSFLRRLAKLIRGLLIPETRQMVTSLERKYPGTKFYIAPNEKSFLQLISTALVENIQERRRAKQPEQLILVGIVCGPMVLKTAEYILKAGMVNSSDNYADVRFVAMNRAGESDSFQYSANYLATRLSLAFPDSKPVAYTFNEHDKAAIAHARNNIDLLLCSAGPYPSPHAEQGYLQRWFERARDSSAPGEGLPGNCIGDFCLIPIDAEGRRISAGKLVQTYHETISPFPEFSSLTDLKEKSKILFPIDIRAKSKTAVLTGKERVAKALLHSGVVNVCIIERPLARNLSVALGDYRLSSVSKAEPDKPMRLCHAFRFPDPSDHSKSSDAHNPDLRNFYVLDPLSRLDAICDTNSRDRSEPLSLSIIPNIIISESREHEFDEYSFEEQSGRLNFRIGGADHSFEVEKGVRKPGKFSIVTLQLLRSYLDRIGAGQKARVWDLGCGTGFIGILTAKLLCKRVEQVLCSDILPEAITCTERNCEKASVGKAVQVVKGDLFNVPNNGQLFDLIAFNAPFLPDALPDHSSIDSGGHKGTEVARRFCEGVREHLRDGGWAVLVVADFVDTGELRQALDVQFGPQNVGMEDRLILYPRKTPRSVALAYEVGWQQEIESRTGYRFETCCLGPDEFVAFNMRHYFARKAT